MKRRFNFTERKRIEQQQVVVEIEERSDGGAPSFTMEMDLGDLGLPTDAEVVVEAYSRRVGLRFAWGTVGALAPPLDRRLADMPVNPSFRVKVVEPREGRLLAMANRVRPHSQARHSSLVWLKGEDLGKEVWRLQFTGTGNPTLLVNNNIHGIGEAAREDRAFRALVMPEVLRAMLIRALVVEECDLDDDDGDWGELLRFVRGFHTEEIASDAEDGYREMRMDWIDRAVASFTRRYFKASDMYAAALRRA